jgi:hypothetical protein
MSDEVNLSTRHRFFSARITLQVDPVRIESIQQSGSPSEVGARIVALEGKKEGVSKVELLGSAQEGDFYTFDYKVESTRGRNRFLARAIVADKKLIVFTIQIPIDAYEANEATISRMLQSLQVNETNGK